MAIGGDAPISVQSMTFSKTTDIQETVQQINRLHFAGADIVRVAVPDVEDAHALKEIKKQVSLPIIADIHFNYKLALIVSEFVDGIRINPGNIGSKERVKEVVKACQNFNLPIRIGVNSGSLEKQFENKYGQTAEGMVASADYNIKYLEDLGFTNIKVSMKASDVERTVDAYRMLRPKNNYPFHLGVTEAGTLFHATVKSSIGLGALLLDGIGDTIRVSLAANPVEEIKVGFDILKSLHLRQKGVNLIACPSCSRQKFDVISVVNELEARLEDIVDPIDVAVIGCVVNGPGEAKAVSVGLTGGSPNLLYINGKTHSKIENASLVDELEAQIRSQLEHS